MQKKCSVMQDLSSCRTSPSCDQYQIILLYCLATEVVHVGKQQVQFVVTWMNISQDTNLRSFVSQVPNYYTARPYICHIQK